MTFYKQLYLLIYLQIIIIINYYSLLKFVRTMTAMN